MRPTAIILIGVLMVLGLAEVGSAQSPLAGPPGPVCLGEADFLTITASVQQRGVPYFYEVEVTLVNRMSGKIQVDPSRFVLTPDQGEPATPLTKDEAVKAARNSSQQIAGFLLFGVVGYLANVETQKRWVAEVEARIFKASELPPGVPVKGSVYFKPNPKMTRFTLTLDGLTAESGDSLATVKLTNCQVPTQRTASAPAPSPTPSVRTIALSARAAAGPMTVSISNAEFTNDVTTLTITIENAADVEVSLFSATGDATLTDSKGKSYAVRMLRSDLPDRVPPHGRVQGKLAFEPLPLTTAGTSAVLTMPEIRVGDDVYEIKAELRF